ncbi:MAG: PHP domain-containing protein [Vicinamibacterales bacterium]
MIDLHLHTTASDGRLAPAALVARAAGLGLTTISVTDHDTTAALAEAADAAARHGLRLVPGIEITAVERARDVHVLGYFFDPDHAPFVEFLRAQRDDRRRRVETMIARLAELGMPLDGEALLGRVRPGSGRAIGRPHVADALVTAGFAVDRGDAFDRFIAEGQPAFVPRHGASVGEVAAIVRAAGGVASLAHPALMRQDQAIAGFAADGLSALEVWHSDHDAAAIERYDAMARQLGLGRSGGSDFHADHSHHASGFGRVTLPLQAFADLEARAAQSARSRRSIP